MSDTYVHKPWKVAAIQWTGENFVEVKQFIYDWIGDQDATGPRNDRDDDFTPTCACDLDGDWWACCDGRVYGPCEDEHCGGVCELKHDCGHVCHGEHGEVGSPEGGLR